MTQAEVLVVARQEKARADSTAKLFSALRLLATSQYKELLQLRDESVRLRAANAELRAAQRAPADAQRHATLDAARLELRAAGLRDFPLLFAAAVCSGHLPPGCIYAQRLSDASRNVTVAPSQRRYSPRVLEHLVYADRCRTGRACMAHLNSSNDEMSKRGEPMPTRNTVQNFIKERAGAASSGVRMGFLPFGAAEFASHLRHAEVMQRRLEAAERADGDGDAPMLEPHVAGLPVVPYRIACDAESIEPELHVNRRTGVYTGDEDLADVGFGADPCRLAAERLGWVRPLERVALCQLPPAVASAALARVLCLIGHQAMPAHDAEVTRLERLRDMKAATYQQRVQNGRGGRRQQPKPQKKPKPPKPPKPPRKRKEPEPAKAPAVSRDDASGPAAGLALTNRSTAGLLVGRIILQQFPDDPAEPTRTFRGRITKLLPVARSGQYAGEFWFRVEYEDGDAEDRQGDELLRAARLVPYAEMTAGELREAAPAALLAELSARGVEVSEEERADGTALAARLLLLLRPPKEVATPPAEGDGGGGGEGDGGNGGGDGSGDGGGDGGGGDGDGRRGDGRRGDVRCGDATIAGPNSGLTNTVVTVGLPCELFLGETTGRGGGGGKVMASAAEE